MHTEETVIPSPQPRRLGRRIAGFLFAFLLIPIIVAATLATLAYREVDGYMADHSDRIYTGVSALDIDLSGMTSAEAAVALAPTAQQLVVGNISIVNPLNGEITIYSRSELGLAADIEQMVARAYAIGRTSSISNEVIFDTWYNGRSVAPVLMFDSAPIVEIVNQLKAELVVDPVDADLRYDNGEFVQSDSQVGYQLDPTGLVDQIATAVLDGSAEPITLSFIEVTPVVASMEPDVAEIEQLLSAPLTLYVENPVDQADLTPLTLPVETFQAWMSLDTNGDVVIDANAAQNWLAAQSGQFARESAEARFYFDDLSQELVVIEPHVNGRVFDLDTSTQRLLDGLYAAERSVPLAMTDIVPVINSDVAGADLGITELLAEETTWFYDSTPERKTNIRLGASKFHGIVIKPEETFSFNENLGALTYENGFVDGLVIIGGRTQSGIGGGICQVSTTMFQTVFWAGLDVIERNQHGYRVAYYEMAPDGIEKPIGMDAAIYSPSDPGDPNVDFKFYNNTPHHILVEAYYYEGEESLTFKFYSTGLGRTIERYITTANEQDPPPDRYEYNDELEAETIEQVEWATGGATVSVQRVVLNQWGELRDEDYFVSTYVPWANVYQYGDDANIPSNP